MRQVIGFDCGREPLVRRLQPALEPTTFGQCLRTGGFEAPEARIPLDYRVDVSCLAPEAETPSLPSLTRVMLAERANLVTIPFVQ